MLAGDGHVVFLNVVQPCPAARRFESSFEGGSTYMQGLTQHSWVSASEAPYGSYVRASEAPCLDGRVFASDAPCASEVPVATDAPWFEPRLTPGRLSVGAK